MTADFLTLKPLCHIEIDSTLGYDPADPQCPQCEHKVSCLAGAVDMGNVKGSPEQIDPEVGAVQRSVMSQEEIKDRIVRRQSFVDANKALPGPLRLDAYDDKRKVKRATRVQAAAAQKRERGAPKGRPLAKKPPRPVDNLPKVAVKQQGPERRYKSGRKLPSHRRVDRTEMERILAKTNEQARMGGRHRFPFDLGIGMTLILHTQAGDVVVEITEQGWCWEGEIFTSISTAFCHALGRSVSGFDLFDRTKDRNCTITGPGVPGGVYSYRDRPIRKR